ncbi:unnamed protein product [marine sediment metagenome]|uniref:Uncharacterized protein n=1 Tax=marine sediment metagenome TaxID=412755 RepID=X1E8Y3_9ZZZZ
MENLPQEGHIRIDGHKIERIETSDLSIRFFSKRASVQKTTSPHRNWLSFEVEKKLYLNSNHSSKITFWASEKDEAKQKKQVEDFIDEIMAEAGMTPIARFSLEHYMSSPLSAPEGDE